MFALPGLGVRLRPECVFDSAGIRRAREITDVAWQDGIAKRTLERAKAALKVRSRQVTGDDGKKRWCWELPNAEARDYDMGQADGSDRATDGEPDDEPASGRQTPEHQNVGDLGALDDLNSDPGRAEDRRDASGRQVAKDANISMSRGLATWAYLSQVREWVPKKRTRRAESAESQAAQKLLGR